MSWAELKKVVNDNFNYPLNKQNFFPVSFGTSAEWFEQSTTYTVAETGIYVITCVGKGGNANGTAVTGYVSTDTGYFASGGGGAVCKGYYKLTAGQTIAITVDATKSSFGSYISAGAGANGTFNYSSLPSAAAGGAVLIAGNITNHAGYPGPARNALNGDNPGGNAGIITPWSLNGDWSRGYLPFINWTEITGGKGGVQGDTAGGEGKFGGGHGADYAGNRNGAQGGGGYGGGGNWNDLTNVSGYTNRRASYSEGGKGVVIVEHGVMLLG